MTTLLISSNDAFSYDVRGIWTFYTKWENGGGTGKVDYVSGNNNVVSVYGDSLVLKSGAITSGTIEGVTISSMGSTLFFSDIELAASKLNPLLKAAVQPTGNGDATVKVFAALFAGDDDITLGFGNDRIATFGGDDVIQGRAGKDWIDAGSGDDTIYGGVGNDTLFGRSGEDFFVFDTKASTKNMDTIDDFSVKDDTIIIDHLVYRAVGRAGELASSAFWSNTTGKAHDASDRIVYNSKTGALLYDADGTGDGAAVQFAKLDAGLKLSASDFDLI